MNLSMIRYILGYVLAVEGLLMAPCSLVGLIYGEQEGWWFLAVGAVSLALGLLIAREKPSSPSRAASKLWPGASSSQPRFPPARVPCRGTS